MQTLELSSMLADAAAKVLETMCFVGILGEAPESAKQDVPWIAAKLDFVGDISGNLGIGVSPASARSLTSNFLGIDTEELSQMQIDEVIGELANMVAGSFVSGLESHCCFALSHPQMELPDEFSKRLQSANSYLFELEDGFFAVWLEIHLRP